MTETPYLVHGVWLESSGLHLWLEATDGHRILAELPADIELPAYIRGLLAQRPARHVIGMTLQTPQGKRRRLNIPTWAWHPGRAIEVLTGIHATCSDAGVIAPDLRFLTHMCIGVEQFVLAGRVLIRAEHSDGEWYPRWTLAQSVELRSWLADMTAAAPQVLLTNSGANFVTDMAEELAHPIATAKLQAAPQPKKARHQFVETLLSGEPLRRFKPDLVRLLNRWRGSLAQDPARLYFALTEPTEDVPLWQLNALFSTPTITAREVAGTVLPPEVTDQLAHQMLLAKSAFPLLHGAQQVPGSMDFVLTPEEVVALVQSGAQALAGQGITVLLPRNWSEQQPKLVLETTPEGEVYGAVRGGTDGKVGFDQLVSYKWQLALGDDTLTDAEMSELTQAQTGLVRIRGKWVFADPQMLERALEFIKTETTLDQPLGEGEKPLRELWGQAVVAPSTDDDLPIAFTGTGWAASLFGAELPPTPPVLPQPKGVNATLRTYQQRGFEWLAHMQNHGFGAILADDMGLGKTLQVLTLVQWDKEQWVKEQGAGDVAGTPGPTLIVAPTTLVDNWAREAAKFTPGLTVRIHHGAGRAKEPDFSGTDLVLTTYGVVSRDIDKLAEQPFARIVFDEAQAVKNPTTRTARAVRALQCSNRVALTGTPMENHLSELWAIMDLVNPGILGSSRSFRHNFAMPIETKSDDAAMEKLQRITSPFILRRLKTDPRIVADLPDKREVEQIVPLTAEQAALYRAYVEEMQQWVAEQSGIARRGRVLAALTRLRQICNHPAHFLGDGSGLFDGNGRHRSGKVAKLQQLMDDAVQTDAKVLIFTQFRAFGDLLLPWLQQRYGTDIEFLHGGLSRTQRSQIVADFQQPDGPRAMMLSLKAGGTGLTLTAATRVIHLDRWWNPAVENQATDRAYRIGQTKDVEVIKLLAQGTLEEHIAEVISGKQQLSDAVISPGDGWITELSIAELRDLVELREAGGEASP